VPSATTRVYGVTYACLVLLKDEGCAFKMDGPNVTM